MHRLFNVVESATSVTAYFSAHALSYASKFPSISTLIQMNVLGEYTLMLALGTLLETYSCKNLIKRSIKDSVRGEPLSLKLKNIGRDGTKLTLAKLAGATIGYYLFSLMNQTDLSLSCFLSIVAAGSSLFTLSVPIVSEIIKYFAPPLLKGIFCTIIRHKIEAKHIIEQFSVEPIDEDGFRAATTFAN